MAIEIVDLPMKNKVVFHSFLYVYVSLPEGNHKKDRTSDSVEIFSWYDIDGFFFPFARPQSSGGGLSSAEYKMIRHGPVEY